MDAHQLHQLANLTKTVANQGRWIEYLEAERKALMSRIDDLEGVVSQIVNDYASRAEEQQALEDRIGAAADKLREAHATLTGQTATGAASAPAPSPETTADAGTQ